MIPLASLGRLRKRALIAVLNLSLVSKVRRRPQAPDESNEDGGGIAGGGGAVRSRGFEIYAGVIFLRVMFKPCGFTSRWVSAMIAVRSNGRDAHSFFENRGAVRSGAETLAWDGVLFACRRRDAGRSGAATLARA